MKKIIVFVVPICLIAAVYAVGEERSSTYIHPSFKLLLTLYPRGQEIVNPGVPRISAKNALSYYGSGKAIFIAAGPGAINARLPGAVPLTESLRLDPSGLKKYTDKLIIVFCH